LEQESWRGCVDDEVYEKVISKTVTPETATLGHQLSCLRDSNEATDKTSNNGILDYSPYLYCDVGTEGSWSLNFFARRSVVDFDFYDRWSWGI
jgi:hypothetical protein